MPVDPPEVLHDTLVESVGLAETCRQPVRIHKKNHRTMFQFALAQIFLDEIRKFSLLCRRSNDDSYLVRVLPGTDLRQVDNNLVPPKSVRSGIDLLVLRDAHRSAWQTEAVAAKPSPVIRPVRATPEDRRPDHVGLHAVPIIDHRNIRDLMPLRLRTIDAVNDIDALSLGLNRVVYKLVDCRSSRLVAAVAHAFDEGLSGHKAETRVTLLLQFLYIHVLPLVVSLPEYVRLLPRRFLVCQSCSHLYPPYRAHIGASGFSVGVTISLAPAHAPARGNVFKLHESTPREDTTGPSLQEPCDGLSRRSFLQIG